MVQVTRQLAMVDIFGVAGATAVVLGKTIGEGKGDLAKIYARRFVRLSFILGLCGGAVVLGVSPVARHFLALTPQASEYEIHDVHYVLFLCGTELSTPFSWWESSVPEETPDSV